MRKALEIINTVFSRNLLDSFLTDSQYFIQAVHIISVLPIRRQLKTMIRTPT